MIISPRFGNADASLAAEYLPCCDLVQMDKELASRAPKPEWKHPAEWKQPQREPNMRYASSDPTA